MLIGVSGYFCIYILKSLLNDQPYITNVMLMITRFDVDLYEMKFINVYNVHLECLARHRVYRAVR